MSRMASALVAAAVAAVSSSALAEVPVQPLADLGIGCSPFDVNASGVIVDGVRVESDSGVNVLEAPAELFGGASATTMGRNGIAADLNADGSVGAADLSVLLTVLFAVLFTVLFAVLFWGWTGRVHARLSPVFSKAKAPRFLAGAPFFACRVRGRGVCRVQVA